MSLTLFWAEVFVKQPWMRRIQKLYATLFMFLMIPEEKIVFIVNHVVVILQGSENTEQKQIILELQYIIIPPVQQNMYSAFKI